VSIHFQKRFLQVELPGDPRPYLYTSLRPFCATNVDGREAVVMLSTAWAPTDAALDAPRDAGTRWDPTSPHHPPWDPTDAALDAPRDAVPRVRTDAYPSGAAKANAPRIIELTIVRNEYDRLLRRDVLRLPGYHKLDAKPPAAKPPAAARAAITFGAPSARLPTSYFGQGTNSAIQAAQPAKAPTAHRRAAGAPAEAEATETKTAKATAAKAKPHSCIAFSDDDDGSAGDDVPTPRDVAVAWVGVFLYSLRDSASKPTFHAPNPAPERVRDLRPHLVVPLLFEVFVATVGPIMDRSDFTGCIGAGLGLRQSLVRTSTKIPVGGWLCKWLQAFATLGESGATAHLSARRGTFERKHIADTDCTLESISSLDFDAVVARLAAYETDRKRMHADLGSKLVLRQRTVSATTLSEDARASIAAAHAAASSSVREHRDAASPPIDATRPEIDAVFRELAAAVRTDTPLDELPGLVETTLDNLDRRALDRRPWHSTPLPANLRAAYELFVEVNDATGGMHETVQVADAWLKAHDEAGHTRHPTPPSHTGGAGPPVSSVRKRSLVAVETVQRADRCKAMAPPSGGDGRRDRVPTCASTAGAVESGAADCSLGHVRSRANERCSPQRQYS
jgi:hypothetical protein